VRKCAPSQRRARLEQASILPANYRQDTETLVVVLVPGLDIIGGGVLSLSSIFRESRRMLKSDLTDVVMCTLPRDPLLIRFTKFETPSPIFSLGQVLSYMVNLKTLFIHVPEAYAGRLAADIGHRFSNELRKPLRVHFNVLIQNIELGPRQRDILDLKKFGTVSCTLSHDSYVHMNLGQRFDCAIFQLSTYVSPEQYVMKRYDERENLMVVSPDYHPLRRTILKRIGIEVPSLRIVVVHGIPYREYKQLISRAKWALTFGEGLDGYFLETILSGGIGFAVFNANFFTDDFSKLRTVYPDYNHLASSIVSDITDLNTRDAYANYQRVMLETCRTHYDFRTYLRNLETLYSTCLPASDPEAAG
jgi:hypothetical protein